MPYIKVLVRKKRALKGKYMTSTCACGKEFTKYYHPYSLGRSLERFCSPKCTPKYSWYGKHGWLFNRSDLKTYTSKI